MYTFELLLTQEHTTAEDWQRFINVLSTRVKGFRPFTLDIAFDGSVVRYFVQSKKDLSHISNGLDGFLLIPVNEQDVKLTRPPHATTSAWLIRVPKFGNILDVREKYLVKKGYNLTFARFSIQRVFGFLSWRRSMFFEVNGTFKRSTNQVFATPTQILDIDFFSNSSYVKKRVSSYLDIEKTSSFFNTRRDNAILKIDTFPYTTRESYLHLADYEFDKHSFIVGSSGSGSLASFNFSSTASRRPI